MSDRNYQVTHALGLRWLLALVVELTLHLNLGLCPGGERPVICVAVVGPWKVRVTDITPAVKINRGKFCVAKPGNFRIERAIVSAP